MGIGAITSLRDVRQNLLGYTLEGAARLSGMNLGRLRIIEADPTDMTMWEAEVLGRLYGLDSDLLSMVPLGLPAGEAVCTLGSVDEFHQVSDATRAAIVRVARAVREIKDLRAALDVQVPDFPRIDVEPTSVPWRDGKAAALLAREKFGPGKGAIPSMRDWVRDGLPGVPLLYAHLGDRGPAGLTFAGGNTGAALVLNLDGKNTNPAARRVSLAHELYHLLVDWDRTEPLATLSGYLEDRHFDREQRANSFAVRFLYPERAEATLPHDHADAARELIVRWGLPYAAARLYLRNQRNADLPAVPPPDLRATGAEANWEAAEQPHDISSFPVISVAPERRSLLARLAAQAYSLGRFPRDRFAELLDVTPAENLESVLDFFGFDLPEETAAA